MKIFSALIHCIEESQAELLKLMEEKQNATERQAEQFIRELEQEIIELKMKNNEMDQLLNTQDHLKFLQVRKVPLLNINDATHNLTTITMLRHFFFLLLNCRFIHFCMDLYTTTTGMQLEIIII